MAGDEVAIANDDKAIAGIPKAIFVDHVDEYMKTSHANESAEVALRNLDENHSKYKYMEYNLTTKKNRLKAQIPDIKSSLDIVKHMQSKKESPDELKMHYQLSNNLYAKARVPPTDKVYLWLGANVMLEYQLDDAETLLQKNCNAATSSLEQVEDDLSFLRDQLTTVEVNMARVYNWDVKRKQAAKLAASS